MQANRHSEMRKWGLYNADLIMNFLKDIEFRALNVIFSCLPPT